ncbi:hypothetical protein PAPYR_233 [Paratrimastix pyriformis]|uniref:C3H1-type domain-containing protein n=1 Tax=Paratrimastix pyriformis TaxID=342808 RepID=A0ABQ8UWP1_9EUKA|nr:hypothetical protein PAPYR_233 [Paratrimastix pyriformis]
MASPPNHLHRNPSHQNLHPYKNPLRRHGPPPRPEDFPPSPQPPLPAQAAQALPTPPQTPQPTTASPRQLLAKPRKKASPAKAGIPPRTPSPTPVRTPTLARATPAASPRLLRSAMSPATRAVIAKWQAKNKSPRGAFPSTRARQPVGSAHAWYAPRKTTLVVGAARGPKKRGAILIALQAATAHCLSYCCHGTCTRKACPYLHNQQWVALCPVMLNKGKCDRPGCRLSHTPDWSKLPVCKDFLQGICPRSRCPFLHVAVDPKAKFCVDFLSGHCPRGDKCSQKHSFPRGLEPTPPPASTEASPAPALSESPSPPSTPPQQPLPTDRLMDEDDVMDAEDEDEGEEADADAMAARRRRHAAPDSPLPGTLVLPPLDQAFSIASFPATPVATPPSRQPPAGRGFVLGLTPTAVKFLAEQRSE